MFLPHIKERSLIPYQTGTLNVVAQPVPAESSGFVVALRTWRGLQRCHQRTAQDKTDLIGCR